MKTDDTESQEIMWPSRHEKLFVEAPPFQGAWPANRTDERLYRMIRGFHETGDILAAACVGARRRSQNLLYPIICNYRQSLELHLKYLLMVYGPVAGENPDFQNHGLKGLWTKCKRVISHLEGSDYPGDAEALQAVDAQIADFDEVDPGSYSFRFAHDTRGGPIPLEIPEIDLQNLRKVIESLHNFLECIDLHLHYGCGVPRCSH
jgi:hypothetical protein